MLSFMTHLARQKCMSTLKLSAYGMPALTLFTSMEYSSPGLLHSRIVWYSVT